MIDNAIKELKSVSSKINLEFNDLNTSEYYDQFETPFFWKFSTQTNYKAILNAKFIKGIVFDLNDPYFNSHEQEVYQLISELNKLKGDLVYELHLDWDSDFTGPLFDFFNFDLISLSVSNKVEKSYRQLDFPLVEGHLKHVLNEIQQEVIR